MGSCLQTVNCSCLDPEQRVTFCWLSEDFVHHVLSWCKSHVLVEKQLFRFAQAFIMLSLFSVSEELSFTGFVYKLWSIWREHFRRYLSGHHFGWWSPKFFPNAQCSAMLTECLLIFVVSFCGMCFGFIRCLSGIGQVPCGTERDQRPPRCVKLCRIPAGCLHGANCKVCFISNNWREVNSVKMEHREQAFKTLY